MNTKKKHSKTNLERVDCLCIGTSIIMSLEAIHQSNQGKKVLMVDSAESYGGAWKTIEIDGIKDVENAIHYFLPDEKGIKFLKDTLGWPIEKSKGKYRYFNLLANRYLRFRFDSLIGRFLHLIWKRDQKRGLRAGAANFFSSLKTVIFEPRAESFYVKNGATGILCSMKNLLNDREIDIRFNTKITNLFFDLDDRKVVCHLGDKTVISNSLVLGHGARLPLIKSKNFPLELNEKFHPRPAFHLVVEDELECDIFEVIFENDRLIKYVHNVTRFSSLGHSLKEKRKVFVFALHESITDYETLADDLFEKLKCIGILGIEAQLKASLYSDIILPTLYDEDLDILKDAFGDLIKTLRTENFTAGIGYYADRWKI